MLQSSPYTSTAVEFGCEVARRIAALEERDDEVALNDSMKKKT